MKIYLELSEMKTIREALYAKRNDINNSFNKEPDPSIRDAYEEEVAQVEKLILHFNDKIRGLE